MLAIRLAGSLQALHLCSACTNRRRAGTKACVYGTSTEVNPPSKKGCTTRAVQALLQGCLLAYARKKTLPVCPTNTYWHTHTVRAKS